MNTPSSPHPSHRDDLRKAYASKVNEREQRTLDSWKLRLRAEFLELLLAEGVHTLIEIGAGTGQDSLYFAQRGIAATATDLTPENVVACQKKGLPAFEMDICAVQIPDASFKSAYSLNCLLHLSKIEFPIALLNIQRILSPTAPFFLGLWGGPDKEGIYEEDRYSPKRFFSFFSDKALKSAVKPFFEIERFERISVKDSKLHFQALFLRSLLS